VSNPCPKCTSSSVHSSEVRSTFNTHDCAAVWSDVRPQDMYGFGPKMSVSRVGALAEMYTFSPPLDNPVLRMPRTISTRSYAANLL